MHDNQPSMGAVFPRQEWERATPESQGVDPAGLKHAFDTLKRACGTDGITQVAVVRNGYLIYEGPGCRIHHSIWSCTKSFSSTILGLFIADGLCALDDRAAHYEPLLNEKYPAVTLRHFVTMTSGYHAVGIDRWGNPSRDWSIQPFMPDDPLFSPGTAFAYWDNAMNMFGRVLVQIARRDLKGYLEERVAGPIGMGALSWWAEYDLDGIPIHYPSGGLETNALDLARFGWLFANRGCWDGKQVVPAEWIDEATRTQVPPDLPLAPTDRAAIDGRGVYGYNWWVNGIKPGGQRQIPHAPAGVYYAAGLHNNHCFVVPEWNMVVVRMGIDERQAEDAYDRFFALLAQAMDL